VLRVAVNVLEPVEDLDVVLRVNGEAVRPESLAVACVVSSSP